MPKTVVYANWKIGILTWRNRKWNLHIRTNVHATSRYVVPFSWHLPFYPPILHAEEYTGSISSWAEFNTTKATYVL
jgi:hypothetical protein